MQVMATNKVWYLKRINVFQCLRVEERAKMLRQGEQRVYQRRQLIFKPQDRGDAIYLIEEGQVKLSRFDDRGREVTLAILESGEFFGEESLGGEELRESYAEALSEARVIKVSSSDFERLMAENSDLALAVTRQMTRRYFGAHARIESLAFSDVTARLADLLVRLAEEHGEALPGGGVRVSLELTHQELASLIASTRETTTTLLGKLRREGLVRSEGRHLVVEQLERLRELAQTG